MKVRSIRRLSGLIADDLQSGDVAFDRPKTGRSTHRRTAIFAIHGVSPIQRFAFQDQFAGGLTSYLNALEVVSKTRRAWKASIFWPRAAKTATSDPMKLYANALRLTRDDVNGVPSSSRTFDVFEGYWSPLSKGKTNIVSLLQWLVRCTFLATSSTAAIPSDRRKFTIDVGYLCAVLGLGVLLLAGAFFAADRSWTAFLALYPNLGGLSTVDAANPLNIVTRLPWYAFAEMALDVFAAYLIVQIAIVAGYGRDRLARTQELRGDASSTRSTFSAKTESALAWHRWALVVFAGLTVVTLFLTFVVDYRYHRDLHGHWIWSSLAVTLCFLATVACVQGLRRLAAFLVEDILGDIQVYTTHDYNSAFFATREQIISTVLQGLVDVLNAVDESGIPLYGDVHVAAHSLGSTIGLDVLMRARMLVQEGSIELSDWNRIRTFTTFGTALEKTRFFFDVRNATISAAQSQWQGDAYGPYFDAQTHWLDEPANGAGVIVWRNLWYEEDIIANEIKYDSDVPAGASQFTWARASETHQSRRVCHNVKLRKMVGRPFYAFVHGDYMSDPAFWKEVAATIVDPQPSSATRLLHK